jgi:ferritin-like metal-binding protein YciE
MASIDTLHALLVEELRDIYDAEERLTKAIPKLADASSNGQLTDALNTHLGETESHVTRLEQAFAVLDEKVKGKTCDGMKGLISEGEDHAGDDYDNPGLRDAAIIGSAQRVEHYEIAAYGTAIAHARLLGENRVAELLETTLTEEKNANQILTRLAEQVVNPEAVQGSRVVERQPRTTM